MGTGSKNSCNETLWLQTGEETDQKPCEYSELETLMRLVYGVYFHDFNAKFQVRLQKMGSSAETALPGTKKGM